MCQVAGSFDQRRLYGPLSLKVKNNENKKAHFVVFVTAAVLCVSNVCHFLFPLLQSLYTVKKRAPLFVHIAYLRQILRFQ